MTGTAPRPFLRPQSLGLVALGGTLGSAAREGLVLAMPDAGPVPWAVFLVNLAGAFVLGFLYEELARPRWAGTRGAKLRLVLGTGFCGGFTTYSTLATGTAALAGWTSGAASPGLGWAAAYALGTVVLGALATWCGILAGSRRFQPAAATTPTVTGSTGANSTGTSSTGTSSTGGADGGGTR
ncbi:hypothetical protein B5P43_28765 [Bacillus sp. SRB_336]|nr:hypothetical protein B5P43_28765 [Bacillus sp. SRB_336]